MARKNVFDISSQDDTNTPTPDNPPRGKMARPLLGIERDLQSSSPVGAISRSLDDLNAKAAQVEEIEKRLATGQMIIEIDTDRIDPSIIADRMSTDAAANDLLAEQIRENGQQVPVLVRPHPTVPGRFQVSYGHRRVEVCRKLGITVRAIVRELTDEQLIVSQGQENNSREDLSYIERCYFAYRLEGTGFGRDIIMTALGVDKTVLSKMMSLVAGIPRNILEAIGPAPSYGRVKWLEISKRLETGQDREDLAALLANPEFSGRTSDERFELVHHLLTERKPRLPPTEWRAPDGTSLIRISRTDRKLTMSFNSRADAGFGPFVQEQLQTLYEEYVTSKKQEN